MGTYIDPKLAAGAGLGPALAVVLWISLYMFLQPVRDFAQDDAMTFGLLVLATGSVFGGLLGYRTRNAGSPMPADQLPGRVEPMDAAETAALVAEHDQLAGR